MRFYRGCPRDHGYPRFGYVTFLDRNWIPHPNRTDTIPATQLGMGILSYLKYAAWFPAAAAPSLSTARALGDYLTNESLTPNAGKYPAFTRSTGTRERFPLPPDAGSQGDRPFEIEPDKGGIAGYALVSLFEAAGGKGYLDQAQKLGGKTLVRPVPIPTGTFAWLQDPEGNTIGLWKPSTK